MSAVIYAAIVVMWAVVLVPMWLRRHEDSTEPRPADRFSTAMRILSRRPGAKPAGRSAATPPRQSAVSAQVSAASAPKPPAGRPTPAVSTSQPATRATSIVVRRRRMLLGLLGATGLTLLLAIGGIMSWPLQIVVDVVLIAFAVHLRAQARRAVAVSRQRRRATAAPGVRPAASVAAPAAPRTESPPSHRSADPALPERAVEVTGTNGVTRTWVPVPVPPPTYTLKPPAPAAPLIDEPSQAATAPAEPAVGEVASALDEVNERRWAVND